MVLILGLIAGMWTTMAGMGGGMLLLFALAAWWGDPVMALAVTAPALLLGNLHRLVMYRQHVNWGIGVPIVLGALPGAVAGGLLAVAIPPGVIQVAMVLVAVLALARVFNVFSYTPGTAALVPTGAGIGAIGATTGGAGLLVGPLLLSCGLGGVPYVVTAALFGVTMHFGRLLGYGAGGWVDGSVLMLGLGIAGAIMVGNALGGWLRKYVKRDWQRRIELGTAVSLVGMSVVGALL